MSKYLEKKIMCSWILFCEHVSNPNQLFIPEDCGPWSPAHSSILQGLGQALALQAAPSLNPSLVPP